MGRVCTCCAHPERDEIDACVTRGDSTYVMADRFGLSASAVQRHAKRHLSVALAAMRMAEQEEGARLSAGACGGASLSAPKKMFDTASETGSVPQTLDVLKELRSAT